MFVASYMMDSVTFEITNRYHNFIFLLSGTTHSSSPGLKGRPPESRSSSIAFFCQQASNNTVGYLKSGHIDSEKWKSKKITSLFEQKLKFNVLNHKKSWIDRELKAKDEKNRSIFSDIQLDVQSSLNSSIKINLISGKVVYGSL